MMKGEKRERLIEAAKERIYEQGVAQTTLADVAEASQVPLGNVYYYFRSKEALIEAVLAARVDEVKGHLALFEQASPEPLGRLKAYARSGRTFKDQLMRFGCPYATFCQELEKQNQLAIDSPGRLFELYLDWSERQFRLLGKGDDASDLALDLVSAIQGTYLLVNTLHNTDLLDRKITRLEAWLDSLVSQPPPSESV